VSPAQDFFDGGNEIFLFSCEVSKSVRDIFYVWSWRSGSAKEVRSGLLR
jgi:hypothetical protein